MTEEGILQKTFNPYLGKYTTEVDVVLSRLQQELIVEIKKELHFMQYKPNDQFAFMSITGHKLLGDYLGGNE